jgi:prolyl-tRNA editing enzyme YbaK/EbsC (Cys-tRNA(Pro) deacylase)
MRPPQNPTAIKYQQLLTEMGIDTQVVEFEQATRTAQDAADAIGCDVGQIVKSLIFRSQSGQGVLVLTSGSNRVDEQRVRDLIGEPLGKADADFVRAATGYAIGGVPPFGHAGQLSTYIDEDFLQYETIWAAAGTPNAVFSLTPDELVSHSGGRLAAVSEA